MSGDDVRARGGPAAGWAEVCGWDADFCVAQGGNDPHLPPAPAPVLAIVVDVAGGRQVTAGLRAELTAALAAAPPTARIALVLAGRAVTVVDVPSALDTRGGTPAAAAALPGGVVPPWTLVAPVAGVALAPVGGDATAAAALAACVRAEPGGGVERRQRPRCLGAAVAVALDVVEAAAGGDGGADDGADPTAPPSAHRMARPGGSPLLMATVIVLATGPPSRGPGALASKRAASFWDALADRAAAAGVAVDAFCVGPHGPDAAPALQRLASATGGRVALQEDGTDALASRLASALAARVGRDATLELRWTAPLSVVPVAAPDTAVDAARRLAYTRLPSARAGDCLAFRADVTAPLGGAAAAVQAVASWTDAVTGGRVTRVATRTVAPAADADAALAGVAPDLTALLLVKAAAAAALDAGASEAACADAEAGFLKHVASAAAATRTRARAAGWLARRGGWRLPRPLLPLADALYGAARSPAFAAADAGTRTRALAVVATGGAAAALRAVRPGLYVADPAFTGSSSPHPLIPAPPGDLALAAAPAAVLDCGDVVFVWTAPDGCPLSAAAAVAAAAADLAASRTPPPAVRVVTVDSDAARAAAWRLAPLHRDGEAEVSAQAPFWGGLDAAARAAARALVVPSGDPSFVEWCREGGVEALFDLVV